MKKREEKMNKEQKEVRPVNKSVALILTIVTVLAFAAACFSLGYCSGKKVKKTYAATTELAPYTIEKGAYKGKDTPTFFGHNINQPLLFQANNITYQQLRIRPSKDLIIYWDGVHNYEYKAYYNGAWRENSADIYVHKNYTVDSIFYNWFIENFEEYVPTSYTCTLDEKTSGLYSFSYIEGPGTVYDENAETITGTPDTYFQVQLMPFEGYMVDIFTVTDSDGTAKSIVKNSSTLYTITIGNEDFVLNVSATVKPIVYTLTIQFEGVGFAHTATPTGNSEKISDNIFECDTGSGAYVAIGPQDDYIIEEISYNVDSGVATIQESGVNGYRVLRDSGNAVVTFIVTTKTDSVVISSGYYWLRSFGSPPNYSTRYTIAKDDFQAIRSIVDGEVVWESLAGFIPYDEYSPWFYFESAPATKVQVFAPGSYRITSVPSGVSNPYSSPVALWYPVIYIPEDIKQSQGYSSTLVSFMTGGVYAYKSDIQYYNAFYIELPSTQASIPTSLPSGLSGVTIYTPSQDTLISPQSVNLQSLNNVSTGAWTLYYTVDFAGRPAYGEYTGAWFGIEGGRKRSVYNQTEPFYADGNIYINSTVMPLSVYSFLNSAFNISSVPIDVDPPSADYWIGLDTVLSYQIFGIPLSVLLAVVISSVFVVVVIRLFAGG